MFEFLAHAYASVFRPANVCLEVTVVIFVVIGWAYTYHRQRMPAITLGDLGVAAGYNFTGLNMEAIEDYLKLKAQLKEKYAPNAVVDSHEGWLDKMAEIPRNLLKYRLMKRAVNVIPVLDRVQKDRKGQYRLYQAKVLPEYAWNSFLCCENIVVDELDAVGVEASKLEPDQDPQSIISDAARLWHTYGNDWDKASRMTPAQARQLQHQHQAKRLASEQAEEEANASPPLKPVANSKQVKAIAKKAKRESANAPKSKAFSWRQEGDDVEVTLDLPKGVFRKDIQVKITRTSICVDIKGKTALSGVLTGAVSPEMSTFTVDRKQVQLSLEKEKEKNAKAKKWTSLFQEAE